jgi:hypothetical protein
VSGEALVVYHVVASGEWPEQLAPSNMVFIPGGTFRMGSDEHYRKEAPVHRVTVDGFWIDRTPVTDRQFRKFVNDTVAENTPNPKDYRERSHAARHAEAVDMSTNPVGFRCVIRERKWP